MSQLSETNISQSSDYKQTDEHLTRDMDYTQLSLHILLRVVINKLQ